jgi:hypothetical protein
MLFTISTVITHGNICALCKNEIKEFVHTQVHLPCGHKFHRDCFFIHIKITPFCPVSLVSIHITSEGRITNWRSYNLKLSDKTVAKYSKIEDKKNYVLPLDTQRISSKKECLYFFYSTPTDNIVACSADSNLQPVLLTPFTNKKKNWKLALVKGNESNSWNENTESIDDYFDNFYEKIQEELIFTIKGNGIITGDVVESNSEIDEKRSV